MGEKNEHSKLCPFGGFKASAKYKRENRHWPNCNCGAESAARTVEYWREVVCALKNEIAHARALLTAQKSYPTRTKMITSSTTTRTTNGPR